MKDKKPDDMEKNTQVDNTAAEGNSLEESPFEDEDTLDDALFEMQMLYRSRCVDVPLTSNVKVVDLEEENSKTSEDE